jgi:hypothetical protein
LISGTIRSRGPDPRALEQADVQRPELAQIPLHVGQVHVADLIHGPPDVGPHRGAGLSHRQGNAASSSGPAVAAHLTQIPHDRQAYLVLLAFTDRARPPPEGANLRKPEITQI